MKTYTATDAQGNFVGQTNANTPEEARRNLNQTGAAGITIKEA